MGAVEGHSPPPQAPQVQHCEATASRNVGGPSKRALRNAERARSHHERMEKAVRFRCACALRLTSGTNRWHSRVVGTRRRSRRLVTREMGSWGRQQALRAPMAPARRWCRARRRQWCPCPCWEEIILYHHMGTLATRRCRPKRGRNGRGPAPPAQARTPCVCPPTHTALVGAPPTSRQRLPAHWA